MSVVDAALVLQVINMGDGLFCNSGQVAGHMARGPSTVTEKRHWTSLRGVVAAGQ